MVGELFIKNGRLVEGAGGGGCFRAGTVIATPNGNKNIEDLREGDPIFCYDEKGNVRPGIVRQTHVHENEEITKVEFWGGEIYVTPNHWVLNQYSAFVEMQTLSVEDALVDFRGHLRPIKSFTPQESGTVYNLTVEPHHTYIADGIRVHNGGGGKKGGGNANTRAPVESPNTLKSVATARVIDLLGEGVIGGLVNGAQSIYFNDTPLENPDGSKNFQGVVWDIRLGYPDQDPMPGFDEVETETIVETEVTRQLGPVVRQINNTDIDAVRLRLRFPNLSYQVPTTGDLTTNSVQVKIEVKPSNGAYRDITFVYGETERTGNVSTGASAVGFRAVVKKQQLVKLNSISSCTLELRYRRVGTPTWISLGERTVSRIIKTVPDVNVIDGYVDGQPVYYHTFTTAYELVGLGASDYEVELVQGDEVSSFVAYRAENLNIEGKNTSPTEKSFRFDLPGEGPWQLRVSRVTPDSTEVNNQNATFWAAYTEIIEEKFIYPDTAYVGIAVNSELFGNQIPKRSYEVYGREVLIPSNYDPASRTYNGFWDGTFVTSWTDNPAWCFLDMVISNRFGLGHVITIDQINTGRLYEISRYCDEMVPDGVGGLEPRFTLNCCINTRTEAYQLLNTLVSVFRGMIYWANGAVSFGQDSPRDVDVIVGRANVIDGEFRYQTSGDQAQHNSILVTWNDPNDFDRPNIEIVEDNRDISVRGLRQTDVYAFGCNSRGQAARYGRSILLTENSETEVVIYRASLDHLNVVPGMIVGIVDPQVMGADFAGRTMEISGTVVTLDRFVDLNPGENYELNCMGDDGKIQSRTIVTGAGVTDTLILASAFNPAPTKAQMWSITGTDIEPRQFRVISIVETENNMFEVTGLEYNPSKHISIDRDVRLTPVKFSSLSSGAVQPPVGMDIQETLFKANNQLKTRVTVSWQSSPDSRVYLYKLAWRTSGGGIFQEKYTSDQAAEIIDIEPGVYDIYVYAIAASGQSLPLVENAHTVLGKTAPPGDVQNLVAERKVDGVILSWTQVLDLDLVGYEIRRGTGGWDAADYVAEVIGTSIFVAIPDAQDTTFLVRAKDELGILSEGVAAITAAVIPPNTPATFTALAQADHVLFRLTRVIGIDVKYEIRRGISWELAELIAETASDEVAILDPLRDTAIYWVKARSAAGLYSVLPRSASASRALIPDRNIILEYDNQNDTGPGAYPGYTFGMEVGPSDSLVLAELSPGVFQPRGEHYFKVDLGANYRARNWLETSLINIAGDGPTWDEWTYSWNDPESAVPWLPLADLDTASLEKVIAWKAPPSADAAYAWSLSDTLEDIISDKDADEADKVVYANAKFQDGLAVNDLTRVAWHDLSVPSVFTTMWKITLDAPLDNRRIMAVLKNDAEGDRIEIGYDAAAGGIYAYDSEGQLMVLPIPPGVAGQNFICIGFAQHVGKRVLYYKSEKEYFSKYVEAEYAPLENAFDRLYLYNAS